MSPIAERLIDWYFHAHRRLPWRETRDPWAILVSEVMLQQTRVAAVLPYYHRFLARFPTPEALAQADEQQLLTLWAGLGYYSRARNLHRAAQVIAAAGRFPDTYDAIRALPGVGDYTAAAVASLAFELPHAVLDGNVLRVVARLTNDGGDIALPATRRRFQATVDGWLDPHRPALFNQAVMELGATVCTPKTPQCLLCPVADLCQGRMAGRATQLPVKKRKLVIRQVEQELVVIVRDGKLLLQQRAGEERRLAGFWELPSRAEVPSASVLTKVGIFRHGIVDMSYIISVYTAKLQRAPKGFSWVPLSRLGELPISTTTRKALAVWSKSGGEGSS